MTTWTEFRENLTTVLGDDNRDEPTWSDAELLMYMNYALKAIADHTADEKRMTEILEEATASYALPADYLALGPVRVTYQSREKYLIPTRREANGGQVSIMASSIPASLVLPDYFYQWRHTLYFWSPLPELAELSVDYYAYWDRLYEYDPEEEEDPEAEISCPPWMEEALLWSMLARCMSKPGLQAATIRPWNTRQDSGSPNDNPPMLYAEYCRKQYERILANHPTQDRTGWESK